MKKTTGSVWNANSWHWEEKNYTKWSKETIKKLIEGYKFHEGSFEFELSRVFSIDGEASINIRKGKQIFIYNFSMNINYKAVHDDPKMTMCYGDIKLEDFNQDDTDLDWEVKSSVTSDCATMALKTFKEVGKKHIIAKIKEYYEKFKNFEFQEKVPESKDQITSIAQSEKQIGQEKKSNIVSEKIEDYKNKEILTLNEAKGKESNEKQPNAIPLSLKEEEDKENKNIIPKESKLQDNSKNVLHPDTITPSTNQNAHSQDIHLSNDPIFSKTEENNPKLPSSTPAKIEQSNFQNAEIPQKIQNPPIEDIKTKPEEKKEAKLGSVWNANSYHWEEKNLTPFSKDCIKEALEKLIIILKGNLKAKVKVEKLKGDSSINIRKGKKCYLFDFVIDLKLQILSSSDNVPFTEGSIIIDQFDQSPNELDMKITTGMRLVDEDDNNKRIKFEINKALKSVKEKIMSK